MGLQRKRETNKLCPLGVSSCTNSAERSMTSTCTAARSTTQFRNPSCYHLRDTSMRKVKRRKKRGRTARLCRCLRVRMRLPPPAAPSRTASLPPPPRLQDRLPALLQQVLSVAAACLVFCVCELPLWAAAAWLHALCLHCCGNSAAAALRCQSCTKQGDRHLTHT